MTRNADLNDYIENTLDGSIAFALGQSAARKGLTNSAWIDPLFLAAFEEKGRGQVGGLIHPLQAWQRGYGSALSAMWAEEKAGRAEY